TRNGIERQDSELNALNTEGKILDGLDRFYADDCTFQEGNEEPIRGKAAQRERLSKLFASLKGFNGATLHAQAIGDGLSVTEWTFDMTGGDGQPIIWNEVLVRQWDDDKVVNERFYQA
ncbi:MAG: YybH family protein, partial [Planctomycetota bacterium]